MKKPEDNKLKQQIDKALKKKGQSIKKKSGTTILSVEKVDDDFVKKHL